MLIHLPGLDIVNVKDVVETYNILEIRRNGIVLTKFFQERLVSVNQTKGVLFVISF